MFEAVGYGSCNLGKVLVLPVVVRRCLVQPASSEYADERVCVTGEMSVG